MHSMRPHSVCFGTFKDYPHAPAWGFQIASCHGQCHALLPQEASCFGAFVFFTWMLPATYHVHMLETTKKTDLRQRSILALVLLAILLAVVGAAWQLSTSRGAKIAAAADLLQQVRKDKLTKYWPDETTQECFLGVDPSGKALTWIVKARQKLANGYQGASVQRLINGPALPEKWQLSASAASGRYVGPANSNDQVEISMRDGRVSVTYARIGPPPVLAQRHSLAPANYIPKGMKELVLAQAAKAGRAMMFRIIENDQPIAGQEVHFTSVEVQPAGPNAIRWKPVSPGSKSDLTYTFDEEGQLLKIADGDFTIKRTTMSQLLKSFPNDERLRNLALPAEEAPQPEAVPHVDLVPRGEV